MCKIKLKQVVISVFYLQPRHKAFCVSSALAANNDTVCNQRCNCHQQVIITVIREASCNRSIQFSRSLSLLALK